MKVGDIIRSTTKTGRYIRVTDVHRDGVFGIYLSKIGNISEEIRLPEDKYEKQRIYRLSVSREEFERICKYETTIKHEATPSWDGCIDAASEGGVDLIMFYNGTKKVYYTWNGLYRTYSLVWNKARTTCMKKPCVKILLSNIIAIER